MFEGLYKYNHNGEFDFCIADSLAEKCNAPTSKSGVYLVAADNKHLIYIGRSGRMDKDGKIIHRNGGMYDKEQ